MASLMKKLCDTMPVAGVMGALTWSTPGGATSAGIGRLSRHLRFHATLSAMQVSCSRPGRVTSKNGEPIWGYEVPADPTRIKQITCRVREDSYNNYLVLEELEWGYASQDNPTDFRRAVRVTVDAQTVVELPLVEEARLVTITTKDGQNLEDQHALWPLKAMHDPSIVHVFAYDLTPRPGKLEPLKAPDHPEAPKVRRLMQMFEEVNQADPLDELKLKDFLFEDDLWDEDHSDAVCSGTVPEQVDLSFKPIRILVAVSLTVCRERDDYQPGRPMGVGRLYPHVMVIANANLARVEAGIRVRRPKTTTLLDAAKCGCGEMLPDVGSLLVTDANSDAMVLPNMPGLDAPMIFLANLFNYYIADPFKDPALSRKLVPIVSPGKNKARAAQDLVDRDCSDLSIPRDVDSYYPEDCQFRVTKTARQGQFDNIHVAPRMIVREQIDLVVADGVAVPFTNVADWKMDAVTMAPFCAHDCFHMHWRWTDNGNTERATFGWGPKSPYKIVGAPMVPHNQEVGLMLLSEQSFSYLARADGAPRGEWQPFCHHGAGYGLSIGSKVTGAQLLAAKTDAVSFWRKAPQLTPVDGNVVPTLVGMASWALFYWRLRYAVKVVEKKTANGTEKTLAVVERFSFKDKQATLKL